MLNQNSMKTNLCELFACPNCGSSLIFSDSTVTCENCDTKFSIVNNIPRFVTSLTHENFSIQWKKFSDVQLDSINGTSCSRDR